MGGASILYLYLRHDQTVVADLVIEGGKSASRAPYREALSMSVINRANRNECGKSAVC